jgi:hypothetical protein
MTGMPTDRELFTRAINEIEQLRTKLDAVRELHRPFKIYDECGHNHHIDDGRRIYHGVIDIDEIGRTCDDGYQYAICWSCCTQRSGYQTEDCTGHHHGPDVPQCPTIAILDGRDPA